MNEQRVAVVQRQWADCLAVRPMFVPRWTLTLSEEAAKDPSFSIRAAPLIRLSREYWLATSELGQAKDVLEQNRLDRLLHAVQTRMQDSHPVGKRRQGLKEAGAGSLHAFHWEVGTEGDKIGLATQDGAFIDMGLNPPKLLRQLLIRSFEDSTRGRIGTYTNI